MEPKQRVIEAGLTVFARYGYRQTTMELVADEIGLSRQALYRHFPNKEALFAAAIENLHAGAIDAASAAAAHAQDREEPASEVLLAQVLTRSEFIFLRLRESAHAAELAEENVRRCGDVLLAYGRKFHAQLAATIRAQMRLGKIVLIEGLSPEALAGFLMTAARGIKAAAPPIGISELRSEMRRMIPLLLRGADATLVAARETRVVKLASPARSARARAG